MINVHLVMTLENIDDRISMMCSGRKGGAAGVGWS